MCTCDTPHHGFSCDDASTRLDEMTYKDLMGEIIPNSTAGATNAKLPYRDWAPLVPLVKYMGYRGNTTKWFVPNKYNGWDVYIRFDEMYDLVNDTSVNPNEAARLLLWGGNIRMHCNCPSFSFWGFQYILTQLDASIYAEDRFPKVRNPQLKGITCKHGRRVLKVLPFHLGDFASAIKEMRARVKRGG